MEIYTNNQVLSGPASALTMGIFVKLHTRVTTHISYKCPNFRWRRSRK